MSNTYSVIYSFGDSLSDAGDAYLLSSSPYAAAAGQSAEPVNPPYAQETYSDGTQANVFSSGMVWVQDLATTLGLANPGPGQVGATGSQLSAAGAPSFFVDAADGGNPSNYVVLTAGAAGGTDFAIGGSVTGPTDFDSSGSSALTNLQSQIANFQHEYSTPATGALYTVWSGSNDVLNLLGSSAFASQSMATSEMEVAQSAQNEVNAVLSLVQLGAQTILIGNVPNLGLVPSISSQGSTAQQTATFYSQYFNDQLQADIQAASSQLTGVTVSILDTFGLLTQTTAGTVVPGPNGGTITNTTDPAYTGSFTSDNNSEVADPNSYLYFDQLHPTQTGHQALANRAAADLNVVCYCTGTLILTDRGEVAVESLQAGDFVVTASGERRPIRCVSHRIVDCRTHLRPEQAHPIRIARDAFGPSKPAQDLFVSPGHSICVDLLGEVLIPAHALVNGSTVAQCEVDQVTYWHVELDSHDILVANGLPAESYLDMGNRDFFVESDVVALDQAPDANISAPALRSHADFCRPFISDGPLLEAARMQLRRRAEGLGWALDASQPMGDLHLIVDGTRIDPVVRGLTARFAVPAGSRDVWLISTTARPCDVGEGLDDRHLGVRLAELAIDDGFDERRIIAVDDPLLCVGFHRHEGEMRWTAGRARLPTAIWDQHPAGSFLCIKLGRPALSCWKTPQATQTSAESKQSAAAKKPILKLASSQSQPKAKRSKTRSAA